MIVTRFAPSPTGYLHIGGLRTALLSYLWARKNGGKFILRIEDTDKQRNSEAATQAILDAFKWVGMENDGEIYYQSKRDDIYKKYIDQLLEEDKAYKCYMSKEELDALRESQMANKERPRYDGRYRDFAGVAPEGVEPVIRIKSPLEGKIEFKDGIKGEMSFNVDDILDDFIIARADGSPTYNFVVAVDDALMGVNNVIRGDDHLSNTPKQIVVYNALGFELPTFFHVPMIHNHSGKKLSKRDGATDVMEYKTQGYLPEALLNFLIRLGWSHGDQELFSREEMLQLFNPNDLNKSASVYNQEKLLWINSSYIKSMDNEALITLLKEYGVDLSECTKASALVELTKARANTLVELAESINTILKRPESYDEKSIKKHLKEINKELLKLFFDRLKASSAKNFLLEDYENLIKELLEEKGAGMAKLAQPIRISLVGSAVSPSVADVMDILGYEEVLFRIETVLEKFGG